MRICPRCKAQLVETPCGDVRVDRCETCGGAWFDFDEIDRAISEVPRSYLARSLPEGASEHPEGAPPGKCPACGGNFVRVRGELEGRNVRFHDRFRRTKLRIPISEYENYKSDAEKILAYLKQRVFLSPLG